MQRHTGSGWRKPEPISPPTAPAWAKPDDTRKAEQKDPLPADVDNAAG
jgi:hypothetical protein